MAYFVDLDWQKYDIEIDGKETGVTVDVRPFEFSAYQEMVVIFQTLAGADINAMDDTEKQNAGVRLMGDQRFSEFLKKQLPRHAQNVVGMDVKVDGARRAATVDDLATYAAFMSFAMAIFNRISAISALSKEEEDAIKKS